MCSNVSLKIPSIIIITNYGAADFWILICQKIAQWQDNQATLSLYIQIQICKEIHFTVRRCLCKGLSATKVLPLKHNIWQRFK